MRHSEPRGSRSSVHARERGRGIPDAISGRRHRGFLRPPFDELKGIPELGPSPLIEVDLTSRRPTTR